MENKYTIITLMMILLVASPVMAFDLFKEDRGDIEKRPDLKDIPARQILVTDKLDSSYKVRENGDVYFKGLKQIDPIVWIDRKRGDIYHVDSQIDFIGNESISLEFYYDIQPDWIKHITHSGKFERYYFPTQWTWTANCTGPDSCQGGWVTFEVFGVEEGTGSSTFPIGTTGPTWANDGQQFGEFDGSTSYVEGSISVFNSNINNTISSWFNIVEFDSQDNLFCNVRIGNDRICIYQNGLAGRMGAAIFNGTVFRQHQITTGVELNTWHNIIATYDNSTDNLTLYIDGVEDSLATAGDPSTGGTVGYGIGSKTGFDANFAWNGSIDEVLIYNRSLSQAEITLLFANYTEISTGINRTGTPSTDGLVLDINFDDFSVADNSGNGNNGINTNVSFGSVFANQNILTAITDYTIATSTGLFTIVNANFEWTGLFVSYNYNQDSPNSSTTVLKTTGVFIGLGIILFLLIPIFVFIRRRRK